MKILLAEVLEGSLDKVMKGLQGHTLSAVSESENLIGALGNLTREPFRLLILEYHQADPSALDIVRRVRADIRYETPQELEIVLIYDVGDDLQGFGEFQVVVFARTTIPGDVFTKYLAGITA